MPPAMTTLSVLMVLTAWVLPAVFVQACVPASIPRQRGLIFKSFQAIKPYGRGDDSLYIASRSDDAGVFDGVGSWTDLGIDCSQYTKALSKEVVKGISEQRQRQQREGHDDIDLARALEYGMERISAKDINYSGSTTVCMASLNTESRVLSLLNIGDSGCMLFRKREIHREMKYEPVMATHPMVVDYNAPFQIGHLSGDCRNTFSLYGDDGPEPPPAIKASSINDELFTEEKQRERLQKLKELSGITYKTDDNPSPAAAQPRGLLQRESAQELARRKTLEDLVKRHERDNLFSSVLEADIYDVVVQTGDVVVLGTDGMWDNVFLSEIVHILNAELCSSTGDEEKDKDEESERVQGVVDRLSKRVLGTVFNRKKASPFTLARLAYLRQKPSLESTLGNLFRSVMKRDGGATSGNSAGTSEARAGEGRRRTQARERDKKSKGRDFAASYEALDVMEREQDWSPEEETQLKREKVFGGKIDDVTIVVGVVRDLALGK